MATNNSNGAKGHIAKSTENLDIMLLNCKSKLGFSLWGENLY